MSHFVYILGNRPHGAIYSGSTRDLRQRVEQHRSGVVSGHTSRYGIKTLVYFERHEKTVDAVHRERRMKRWRRVWKDELVAEVNPEWRDVCVDIPFEYQQVLLFEALIGRMAQKRGILNVGTAGRVRSAIARGLTFL